MQVLGVHWPELESAGTGPAARPAGAASRASHLVEEALKHGAQPLDPGPGGSPEADA
jgi:hypothetical protein